MRQLIFFVGLLVLAPTLLAKTPPLPDGWRLPRSSELAVYQEFRNRSPVQYLSVRGDFNGDGFPDVARLLVSRDEKRLGLVVTFGRSDGSPRHLVLDRWEVQSLTSIGIDEQPKGVFNIVCREKDMGYDWCRPGEATVFRIANDSIVGFFDEKSSFVYLWRGTKFHKVWTSD